MKKKIKSIFRKLKYGKKADSESYISYLKKIGVRIGSNTVIYSPEYTTIDVTRPWMVEIGENVKITRGVTILTHGYDWSVLRYYTNGQVLGSAGKVTIGNNVFIGMNSTILKGVSVGNNVIIGANSLITRDIPDNSVVAGNPAKIIMNIDEYLQKRRACFLEEAKKMTLEYIKVFNRKPDIDIYHEFFPLFINKNNIEDYRDKINFKFDDDIGNDIENFILNNDSVFNNFDEMIKNFLEEEDE